MDKKILWEAVKEPLRLLVLAVLPLLLAYFETISYEWAGLIIILLRLLDSYLHELGKEQSTAKKESILVKGLTRF